MGLVSEQMALSAQTYLGRLVTSLACRKYPMKFRGVRENAEHN